MCVRGGTSLTSIQAASAKQCSIGKASIERSGRSGWKWEIASMWVESWSHMEMPLTALAAERGVAEPHP
jgi:hypothetical protein